MALRRSPMPRGTKPLKVTKPLERHTGLSQVGRKRRERAEATGKPVKPALATRHVPAVPDDVRAELKKRSGGECEMALIACTRVATDASHRISVKAGGRKGAAKERHDRLSNLMHACRVCHTWATLRDAESKDLGLRLDEHQIPSQEPVLYRGVLSYLDDEGGVHDFEAVGA